VQPAMTDTMGDGRVELDQEFLPLKTLAHVLTAVLATEIVLAAARLVVPLLAQGALNEPPGLRVTLALPGSRQYPAYPASISFVHQVRPTA